MYYLIGIFFNEPIVYTALFWLIDQWNVDSFFGEKKRKIGNMRRKNYLSYHTYIPIPSIHEIDNFCYYVKQKQNKKNEFVILN